MLTRRVLLSAPLLAAPFIASRAAGAFSAFLASVRAQALRQGIRAETLNAAFSGVSLNARVIELDNHQPEFSLTWAQYRARVLPASRLQAATAAYRRHASTLSAVAARYGVEPQIVIGIWGLESGFGAKTGGFSVVESLATLAYDGRRAAYFRGELLHALRILNDGDISARGMTGSWAGAMGQPQFMPSSYLQYAVDFDGDGKRDIWNSLPDVFGSVANYLARCGWHTGQPWGQPVQVPAAYAGATGRETMRPLSAWQEEGIRRIDGRRFSRTDVHGALLQPDGPGGEAFMVYDNFRVIRRYNPSDDYALAVGLLGNEAA